MHYVAIEESRRDLLSSYKSDWMRWEPERAADIEAFARHFYATVPVEDLVDRRLDESDGVNTVNLAVFTASRSQKSQRCAFSTPTLKSMAE